MTFQECYDSIRQLLPGERFTLHVLCRCKPENDKHEVEWELYCRRRDLPTIEAGSPESLITQLSDILAPKGVESVGTISVAGEG